MAEYATQKDQKKKQLQTGPSAPIQQDASASSTIQASRDVPDETPELAKKCQEEFTQYWNDQYLFTDDSIIMNPELKEAYKKGDFTDPSLTEEERTQFQALHDAVAQDKTASRSEKTRLSHLTDARDAYLKASDRHHDMVRAKEKGDMAAAARQAEKMLDSLYAARRNKILALGHNDETEALMLEQLKQQEEQARMHLYEQLLKDEKLSSQTRKKFTQKYIQHSHTANVTSAKLALAQAAGTLTSVHVQAQTSKTAAIQASGESTLTAQEYDSYHDLDESVLLKLAGDNTWNTEESKREMLWGRFKGKFYDYGRKFGYVRTWACRYINEYHRIRFQYHADLAEASRLEDLASEENDMEMEKKAHQMHLDAEKAYEKGLDGIRKGLEDYASRRFLFGRGKEARRAYVREFMERLPLTTGMVDNAVSKTSLPEKTRFYRMVDSRFLSWGLGISADAAKKMSREEIVRSINLRHGTTIVDKGFMSTGYCVDKFFLKAPFMLTLLTPKGKTCYVTSNFLEAEVIFGRNTSYTVLYAIDHADVPKSMTISKKGRDGVMDLSEIHSDDHSDFKGIEIVCKMNPDPDPAAGPKSAPTDKS